MLDFLAFSSDVVPWESVLLALLLAYLLSQWIAGLYTWTYRGLSYSRGYVQSLVLAGIIACMLMLAIGNNLVRGLGIVGTLALIRFRTNLRDPWDMIFIFAVFGVGIAAGTQSFEAAVAGTAVFSLAAFGLYKSGFGSRQQFDGLLRLSLPSSPEVQQRLQQILQSRCRSFVLVTLRETAQGAEHDHAYQVRLWAPAEQAVLVQEVSELPGARGVTLHVQEATVEL